MTNSDPTEAIRRVMVPEINGQVQSDDPEQERRRLESIHGQVWDTNQLSSDFEVKGFMAPFVVVREKSTGKLGSLMFQHHPRFYFGFSPD